MIKEDCEMGNQPGFLNFTYDKALELRDAYNRARDGGSGYRETFTFEGNSFVLGYAYYLLEHLANTWGAPELKAQKTADHRGNDS